MEQANSTMRNITVVPASLVLAKEKLINNKQISQLYNIKLLFFMRVRHGCTCIVDQNLRAQKWSF